MDSEEFSKLASKTLYEAGEIKPVKILLSDGTEFDAMDFKFDSENDCYYVTAESW